MDASNFVETIEKRQGFQISCLEEIAFLKGWLSEKEILAKAELLKKNAYGEYLKSLVRG